VAIRPRSNGLVVTFFAPMDSANHFNALAAAGGDPREGAELARVSRGGKAASVDVFGKEIASTAPVVQRARH
jgi:hypothetical protein